jgi:hypothetical protein
VNNFSMQWPRLLGNGGVVKMLNGLSDVILLGVAERFKKAGEHMF